MYAFAAEKEHADKDEEEKRSTELIARMLMQDQMQDQEDNPYADLYSRRGIKSKGFAGGEDEDEDDFVPEFVIQKAKKMSAKKRARATSSKNASQEETPAAPPAQAQPATSPTPKESNPSPSTTPDGAEKKKRRYAKSEDDKFNRGKWTDEEEALFDEALLKYGRDWAKCSAHIPGRDKTSFLNHVALRKRKYGDSLVATPGKETEVKPTEKVTMEAPAQKMEPPSPVKKKVEPPSPKKSEPASPKKKKEKKKPFRESDLGINLADVVHRKKRGGDAVDAKSKLRETTSSNWQASNDPTADPLTMVRCLEYSGKAGTESSGQPYRLNVHSNVLLIADFHAHLATTEIIGYLAGRWDAKEKLITVTSAFPCKSLCTSGAEVQVEMDPECEIVVREEIEKSGLRVVGWYHSHPTFQPDPSLRDIENQTNYQNFIREEETLAEPFVGAIVSSYDIRMPNWFHIKHMQDCRGQPMQVQREIIQEDLSPETDLKLQKLLDMYRAFSTRIEPDDLWRYCSPKELQEMGESGDGGKPQLKMTPLTKGQKMKKSIQHRLPLTMTPEAAEKYVSEWMTKMEEAWKSTIPHEGL
ncbi:hypothetical protein PROFUN_02072 [Planoprotostelium fungivorum]|uniref:Myb-like, SWIRM and MPN domain-containing protein 1 n=1 Tax=Planoprotostelium fungivorum TaxID=1890364 RepID=A0A2P6NBB5_9EUKA|nr:hypothetical protein PROFUN_02072 [Planoprotostelium fungivorum]